MNYTNKYNIPDRISKWLVADDYDYQPGVLSATTLIKSARRWALMQMYRESLTMDVSDFLATSFGTAIHASLESVGVYGDGDFREKRFFADKNGFQVSGKLDGYFDGVIVDTKTTSVWKYVKNEYDDWIKQLSIYRWLLDRNGIPAADHALIDFFATDWKRSDARRGGGYPPIRYQEIRLDLWPVEKTDEYLGERLGQFAFALGVLPECTPEELWQTESSYAVKSNPDAQRAKRVFPEKTEAEKFAAECGGVVEDRPGKVKACGYCPAAPFCTQCAALKAKGLVDDVD